MLSSIKRKIFNAALSLGAYKLLLAMTGDMPKILVYHRFHGYGVKGRLSIDVFEKQLIELKKRFNVIPLTEAIKIIKGDTPSIKNAIVLTIDDGYSDFYTFAYPILKKHELPATIYVTSDFIDRKVWMWPDRITYGLLNTTCKEYTFCQNHKKNTYLLKGEGYYGRLWKDIIEYCLSVSNEEKNKFILKFENDLQVKPPEVPPEDFSAMSWDELKIMAKNGIEIGAHTSSHPSLSKINENDLSYEIHHCKKRLEDRLGFEIKNFCYPNGTRNDYNGRVMDEVEKAGFESSTVAFSDSKPFKGLYEIRRYVVSSNMTHFRKVIYGAEYIIAKLLNRI